MEYTEGLWLNIHSVSLTSSPISLWEVRNHTGLLKHGNFYRGLANIQIDKIDIDLVP